MNEAKELRVFLDISINKEAEGRLEFTLFNKDLPVTCENFRALCTGERGNCKSDPKSSLHYMGTSFHRIIPGFMAQGGDITKGNGSGGESIYGTTFKDENFNFKHFPFCLAMANRGPDTNSSQFYISFSETSHLNGKHVVFGKLTKGFELMKKIEKQGSHNGKALADVAIDACGQFMD